MARRKFEGISRHEEVSNLRLREDMRPLSRRIRDAWLTPDGQQTMMGIFAAAALLLLWMPLGGEFVLAMMLIFSWVKLSYRKQGWDFPFRVPISANLLDSSQLQPGTNKLKKGDGLMYLGSDQISELPVFVSDNDARTHALLFGTTGSGKTVFLMTFVVNSLIFDGGSSYTDGKGDVKLFLQYNNLTRLFGREEDLLLISFITSGKEFYDRQETLPSNTLNPYANGSSGMCTEASISLMDSGGGDDMWKGRAIAFLGGLIKPLVFLRDQGEILLSADYIRSYFDLPMLERFVYDKEDVWKGGAKRPDGYFQKTYGKIWNVVIRPLKAFMITIPGYDMNKLGKQEQKTNEQHGYITMQLARLFGDLADNYGHIMDTPLGHVDFYDVVINNRILLTLLPALERSPESLGMLGKIIVGGIKQMAAGCLGNRVEGLRREIVDARPTNAKVPFPTIFDEYGYYAVLGFSSMPAQARSLGFMVIFAAQDFASLKKSSVEEADQTWENTNVRGIGRITSGSAAETYTRMAELGGNANVAEISGFERVMTMFGTKLRASENVQIQNKPRVHSDDLHSQADGEFHVFLGKKEAGATKGVMAIARIQAMFSELDHKGKDPRRQPQVESIALNHFARVLPPGRIEDEDDDRSIYGPRGLIGLVRGNQLLPKIRSGEKFLTPKFVELQQLDSLNRTCGGKRFSQTDLGVVSLLQLRTGNGLRMKTMMDTYAAQHGQGRSVAKSVVHDASLSDSLRSKAGTGASAGAGFSTKAESGSSQSSFEKQMNKGVGAKPAVEGMEHLVNAAAGSQPSVPLYSAAAASAEQSTGVEVPVAVTSHTKAEVNEVVEQAQAVGMHTRPSDSQEAVQEAMDTGVLRLQGENLKDRQGMEDFLMSMTTANMKQEEIESIKKETYNLKVTLDAATSYIDDPRPDAPSVLVADAEVLAVSLFESLRDKSAPWVAKSMLDGDDDEDD